MNSIKSLIKKIPVLFHFLKILQDRRYLYHYLQGFLSNKKYRSIFSKAESKLFFKKNDANFEPIPLINEMKELNDNGLIDNPIIISKDVANEIKDFLGTKLMHDPESNNTKYFLFEEKPEKIKRGFYKCEDVVHSPHVLDIANCALFSMPKASRVLAYCDDQLQHLLLPQQHAQPPEAQSGCRSVSLTQ